MDVAGYQVAQVQTETVVEEKQTGIHRRLEDQIVPWLKICQEHDLIDRSFPLVWNNRYIIMYELTEDDERYGNFTAVGVYRFGGKSIYIDKRNDPQSVFLLDKHSKIVYSR